MKNLAKIPFASLIYSLEIKRKGIFFIYFVNQRGYSIKSDGCTLIFNRAQNLRQGIVIKTGFGTWVSQIKLGSFVGIYYMIFNLVA